MVAAAIAGAAVIGAGASMASSSQAAGAQENAANTASNTQLSMYNQTRADQAPWRTSGANAVNALNSWYGLPTVQTQQQQPSYGGYGLGSPYGGFGYNTAGAQSQQPAAPTQQQMMQNIQNLPGYQFNFDQGNQAVQRNLAAQGLLNSGAAGKALTQYGQGYASNAVNDYLNGLRSMAGLGQVATQATGSAAAQTAAGVSQAAYYGGNAAAANYANTGNAINSGLSGLVGAYGMYNQQQANTYGYLGYGNYNASQPNYSTGYGTSTYTPSTQAEYPLGP